MMEPALLFLETQHPESVAGMLWSVGATVAIKSCFHTFIWSKQKTLNNSVTSLIRGRNRKDLPWLCWHFGYALSTLSKEVLPWPSMSSS